MRFKFNKINPESVKALSVDEKADFLDLLIEKIHNNKKITTKTLESENKSLQCLLNFGIISVVAKEKMYFEDLSKSHYLTQSDFEKLLSKYNKDTIDENIQKFMNWNNPKKKDRNNIYPTINKWIKDSNKRILTEDEKNFIKRSYNSYIKNTEISGDSEIKYSDHVEHLLDRGYTIQSLREYWLECIPKEVIKSDDPKYRRRATTVIKEFEKWYKGK